MSGFLFSEGEAQNDLDEEVENSFSSPSDLEEKKQDSNDLTLF